MDRSDVENADRPVYAEQTDRLLVDLALTGDETAFEFIFERYKRHITILAGRFFPNPAEAEEIVQITFTKVFVELKNFRGSHDFSLASWLNRIATNTCLNVLKTRQAKIGSLLTDLTERQRDDFAADLKEKGAEELVVQRDLLEKLLALLSAEDRLVLQLIHGQEMSVAEVAQVFGWSRAKVKIRAFRARRSLNRVIKKFL